MTTAHPAPGTIWFTGLSGAGKSTLARSVVQRLEKAGCKTILLDGDEVRRTLCSDLGFSDEDRHENIRRLGELARLGCEAGNFAVVAAISPLRLARDEVRRSLPEGRFIEVFVDSPLAVCESRDPKGLYRRARRGEITQFTGIDSVYEKPQLPELHLRTDQLSPDECVERILALLSN